MTLVIFDIDGTILNSIEADDKCFIQTYKDLYNINLSNVNWNDFTNVTDLGLTLEIFEKHFKRRPSKKEILKIKYHFENLLSKYTHEFTEIDNALYFIETLSKHSNIEIGFATGGWKETAELKCNIIGLNLNNYLFKSSNDHFNRAKIIELVIEKALEKHQIKSFEKVIYFGDGLWDFKTTQTLGIDFIGVDFNKNKKLKKAGVKNIINNFKHMNKILNWLI